MSEGRSGSYAKSGSRRSSRVLLGEKEGKRGMKIGSMSRKKSSLALKKGRIKHTEQYLALRGMGALTGGTRNLNVCVGCGIKVAGGVKIDHLHMNVNRCTNSLMLGVSSSSAALA
ncbi:hypothetical protein SO802_028202 [Lithocarpus litseifolius]|uniref:Uncharacterized protein n=1 Tax=Lithocarpus litseifolius TaxID=425828 RepID=A0AAW2BRI8_9ROSI